MIVFPFPTETITAPDPAAILDNTMTGRTFRAAIGEGALMSVGAHHVATSSAAWRSSHASCR